MKNTILLLTTLFFLGCGKDDNPSNKNPLLLLPLETQIGANTFGCFIGNKIFVPRNGTGTFAGADYGFSFLGGYPDGAYNELEINDYKSERTTNMIIHLQDLRQLGVGQYIIDESNGQADIDGLDHNYIHCRAFNPLTNLYGLYLSSENSGVVNITRHDLTNGIRSGNFTCKLKNYFAPYDEIIITQGRFDAGRNLPNVVFP